MILDFVEVQHPPSISEVDLRLCLVYAARRVCGAPLDARFYETRDFSYRTAELEIDNFDILSVGSMSFRNVCTALRGLLDFIEQHRAYHEVVVKIYVSNNGLGAAKILRKEDATGLLQADYVERDINNVE